MWHFATRHSCRYTIYSGVTPRHTYMAQLVTARTFYTPLYPLPFVLYYRQSGAVPNEGGVILNIKLLFL